MSYTTAVGDVLTSPISLTAQVEDALNQLCCLLLRHVNASLPPLDLIRPPVDVRNMSPQSSLLATNLQTHGACLWHFSGGVDQAHAAGLASSVFPDALFFEMTPSPVLAFEYVVLIPTHP